MIIADVETENNTTVPIKKNPEKTPKTKKCECLRTSEKLKHILETAFPKAEPPPHNPYYERIFNNHGVLEKRRKMPMSTMCMPYHVCRPICRQSIGADLFDKEYTFQEKEVQSMKPENGVSNDHWWVWHESKRILQLCVNTVALSMYYLLYGYMQVVFYTIKCAEYFFLSDMTMKITLVVVAFSMLVLAVNLMLRLKTLLGSTCD